MPQPLNPDIVRQLLNNPAFNEYIRWVTDLMADLDSVGSLENLSNEEAGELVRVKAKALEKLAEILSPFIEYRTKREITPDEFKKASTNYGF